MGTLAEQADWTLQANDTVQANSTAQTDETTKADGKPYFMTLRELHYQTLLPNDEDQGHTADRVNSVFFLSLTLNLLSDLAFCTSIVST